MPYPIKIESFVAGNAAEITQVDQGVISIGRETENNVIIDSNSVSRHHGCLVEAGSQWVYCDLNSSNGSFVNGMQLPAGNIKLVRSGDIIHIADYPLRLTSADSSGEPAESDDLPTSLLIFINNRFELEFPLVHPGAKFRLGGIEADLPLDDYAEETPALEITAMQGRLEVQASRTAPPTIVAGMASAGVTAVADRDEIEIANIRVIVNDPRFVPAADQLRARQTSIINTSGIEDRISSQGSGPHVRPQAEAIRLGKEQGAGWESEMLRKQTQVGRKFIFGAEDGEGQEDPFARKLEGSRNAFDGSSAQRFSGTFGAQADEGSPTGDRVLILVGGLVFLLVIVLVIILLSML
jgi:pSer/pThr/pTyr-binding forkhead associated (FHA) protein